MTYKPMTATIECPCGKQFEHEFRVRNKNGKIIKTNGRPPIYCPDCATERKTRTATRGHWIHH
jgi:hypothetical protein